MGHGQIEPNQNATLTYLQWDKNLIVECQQLTVNVSFRELIKNVTLKGWGTEALQSIYLVITGKVVNGKNQKTDILQKSMCTTATWMTCKFINLQVWPWPYQQALKCHGYPHEDGVYVYKYLPQPAAVYGCVCVDIQI